MLKTSEVIIRPDGTLWLHDPIEVGRPHRAILIILDEEVEEEKWPPERTEALLKKIRELSPEQRRSVEDFINFLCEYHLRTWKVGEEGGSSHGQKRDKKVAPKT